MSNGHVEIHDLLSLPGGKPSSDGGDMEDTVEFRIVMAYAQRRRPKPDAGPHRNGRPAANGVPNAPAPSQTPDKTEEKTTKTTLPKKKKKGWKRLPSIFKCVKPQTEEAEDPQPAAADQPEAEDRLLHSADCRSQDEDTAEDTAEDKAEDKAEDVLGEVVRRLTDIIEDIPFIPPEIECDAPEESNSEEVETLIGLLLREAGDRLNEQELKDGNIAADLFLNYGFFRSLINALLSRMGLRSPDPDAPGPHASPKTQIAVACEVTSRLSALDSLPVSRLLDHGARYLQDYFSPWVRQQGGYEAAFQEDDEEEVQ